AAVNARPKRTNVAASRGKRGAVLRGGRAENHHRIASGAITPAHSYHAQFHKKKYVRDSSASRAAPVAGSNPQTKGSAKANAGAVFFTGQNRSAAAIHASRIAPYTLICGCTRAVKSSQAAARRGWPERKQATAKTVAGVESERAVT